VKATALDGAALGWPVVVPWGATRSVELQPGDDAAARAELIGRGITVR
jgi:nicotinamidase-related amidase